MYIIRRHKKQLLWHETCLNSNSINKNTIAVKAVELKV